jgi:small redox-active disulfide protein 2
MRFYKRKKSMKVQVLGKGCSKCELTEKLIRQTATQLGVQVELEKVQDLQKIAAMGVMSTPAVAIDGQVVHSGRVPLPEQIMAWLTEEER